jgi:hypothetical protein
MNPMYFSKRPGREPDFLSDRKTIRGKSLILVEGQDDLWFFDKILSDIGADPDGVQAIDYGGAGELPTYLDNLLKSDEVLDGEIRGILITGDSDTFNGPLPHKLKASLKNGSIPSPTDRDVIDIPAGKKVQRVGLFLLPQELEPGNLESVLLATMATDPPVVAARSFVEGHHHQKTPENDKRVSQAYLATRAKLSRGAGWGAKNGYFNLAHESLDALKDVLRKFLA